MKKVIFNSITHSYFWLFTLCQNKTNCNPLAHQTWKCHDTNLWIAKLFHLTQGLLRSFKRWSFWREPVVGCHRWPRKEPVMTCANWNVRQAMSQRVFRVGTFCVNAASSLFSTLINRIVHHAVLKFSPCHNRPLPQASTCPYQYMRSSCSKPQTQGYADNRKHWTTVSKRLKLQYNSCYLFSSEVT